MLDDVGSDCPDLHVLSQYANGIDIEGFEAIDRHVSACKSCAEFIERCMQEPSTNRFRKLAQGASTGLVASGDRVGREGELLIVRRIGLGGMAEVWQAYHLRLDRFVALKISLKPITEDHTGDLGGEARLLAITTHPNIVGIHELFEHKGHHVIVMDYVAGSSLAGRIEEGSVPVELLQRWLLQLLEALTAIRREGLIHGDLKPSNLLIDIRDRLYVADFGVSSLAREATARPLAGTSNYAAPEMKQGCSSMAGDVFALGVIAQELSNDLKQGKSDPAYSADLANALDRWSTRCCQEDPDQRPTDFSEMCREIRNALPEKPAYRGANSSQANSTTRSWTTTLLLLLASGIGGSLLTYWIINPNSTSHRGGSPTSPDNRALFQHFLTEFGPTAKIGFKFGPHPAKQINLNTGVEIEQLGPVQFNAIVCQDTDNRQLLTVLSLLENENIEILILEELRLSEAVARRIASHSRIREVYFSNAGVTDEHVETLAAGMQIRDLGFQTEPITDRSIESLKSLVSLRSISFQGTRVSEAAVRSLKDCEQLRTIQLSQKFAGLADEFRAAGKTVRQVD